MKKSKFYIFAAVSGVLSVIAFIVAMVVDSPSAVQYEVAKAFGDTAKYDFIIAIDRMMGPLCIVFAIAAIALLIVGIVQSKKAEK